MQIPWYVILFGKNNEMYTVSKLPQCELKMKLLLKMLFYI